MSVQHYADGVTRADATSAASILGRKLRLAVMVDGEDERSLDHLLDSVWVETDGEVTVYLDLPAEFGRPKGDGAVA